MTTAAEPPAITSNLRLSHAAPELIQSEIRAMTIACSAANGINMAQGVCDTDPPPAVVEAAIEAIRSGHNIYTRADGIAVLREAIAHKLAGFNKLHVDPHTQVLVTSGATGAMQAALMALMNPGDECIVLEPFYGYHLSNLRQQRIVPVVVSLQAPDWALDLDRLQAAVTSKTRAIILNSPSNPSGKVFSLPELKALADFAIQHDLFVFTDEMYEYFLYDGVRHISIASLPGMEARTITISGFSKTFSVTGWRLGYLAASERWIPAINYFHDLIYVCAPAPLQHGAAAGLLSLQQDFYDGLVTEYQAKRDMVCASLARAGMKPSIPAGAYYILADSSKIPGASARQKARELLKATGVAAVAGSAFFGVDEHSINRGENVLRFCFAKKQTEIEEACRRLESYRA
jgi:aminotransferase